MNIRSAIDLVKQKRDLTQEQMRDVFNGIMSGGYSTEEIAEFLSALADKGETVDEITGAALVMREKAVRIKGAAELIDTCGTGGSGISRFNISTTVALVAAGAGLSVAKHGNRSASSHCGSADVLEALGVKIDIPPQKVEECIKAVGIGFLFAPAFHLAMKYAMPARKMLKRRTIFNILGPLSNPAGAQYQLLGVFEANLTTVLAGVLKNLGTERAMIIHGDDGLDEITPAATTTVSELQNKQVRTYHVRPEDFGFSAGRLDDIATNDVAGNAAMVMAVLKGQKGMPRNTVLMNASAALVVAGKARDFKEGAQKAAASIDSGRALEKLEALKAFTNR